MKHIFLLFSIFSFFALEGASDTFSPDRLITFSEQAVLEQNVVINTAPVNPIYMPGYVLVQVTNTTGQPDSNVYILVKGLNGNGQQSYLNIFQGIGTPAPVNYSTFSTTYSYQLSSLPGTNNNRFFYIQDPFISGRVYFSINYPLLLAIATDSATGQPTIVDPSNFSLNDPNYYTLYDKFEFTYNPPAPGANLYINPTAVDFFSLPISLQMVNPIAGSLSASGFNISRNTVLTGAQSVVTTNDLTSSQVWSNLFLPYYLNPNSGSPTLSTYLRITSPASATGPGSTTVNPSHAFPDDYLSNAATYGFDYIGNAWNFYNTGNQLNIDASEIAIFFGPGPSSPLFPSYYQFSGTVNGSNEFVFTNNLAPPNNYTWTMQMPTTAYPFFAGAGFTDDGEANNTPGAIIVRQITSAFDVGLFPENFTAGNFMNQAYFEANKSSYFTNNPQWGVPGATNGPFYDLYSKSLHSFGLPIYTFAYDDELGQDGTLIGNVEQLQSSIMVTLPAVDTPIPDPYNDSTVYTVLFQYAANNPVQYRNGTSGAFISPVNFSTVPNISSNSTNPLQLMLLDNTGAEQVLTVYLEYGIVQPNVPNFSLASGVVITNTGPNTVTIQTPGL